MQQGLTMDRLAALEKSGATRQALSQAAMEQAYKDFVNQRDYERQNVNWLTGIMAGVPVGAQSEVLQYEGAPNPYSTALGLGLAGGDLKSMMSGSSRGG